MKLVQHPAAALLPVAAALVLALPSTLRESCTVDEFGNLPLTVVFWQKDGRHIDPGNPPLTRWLQGLPLLPLDPDPGGTVLELATIDTSWDLGYRFERAHRDDYHALLVRARIASIALLLLTVAGVYGWARSLSGPGPALAAAWLAALSPNLLAHGRLVTPDIGLACFIVLAGWAAHESRARGSLPLAAATGLLGAAACLSKFSALLLPPALAIVLALGPGGARERGLRVAVAGGVFLVAMFAAYGFPLAGAFGPVPAPLPAPYVEGIETQLAESAYPAYLLGEVKSGGWPWYYLVAFFVKTPLAAIALFLLAKYLLLRERSAHLLPWILAAAFFVAFGFGTKKNIGIRYLLPMFPLLHVGAAAAFAAVSPTLRRTAYVLLAIATISGVRASAAPLAYFNGVERVLGGKRAVLVDSNLDWGQSLPDLREWMRDEGIDSVQLAYFGRVDPTLYGVRWASLPSQPTGGPVAISATLAVGRPYVVRWKKHPDDEPILGWSTRETWAWIKDVPPETELGGGSILVWRDLPKGGRSAGEP